MTDHARLEVVRSTGLLRERRSASLQRLVVMAARQTSAPIALISILDEGRQVFPAAVGLPKDLESTREIPLTHSLCRFVVDTGLPFVVEDVARHANLADHPAVVERGIRAYLGLPVRSPDGAVLGALCLLDTETREWGDDLAGLTELVPLVETDIALRLEQRARRLADQQLSLAMEATSAVAIIATDRHHIITSANTVVLQILGLSLEEVLGRSILDLRDRVDPVDGRAGYSGGPRDWRIHSSTHGARILSLAHRVIRASDGSVQGHLVVGDDVTEQRASQRRLREAAAAQQEIAARMAELSRAREEFVATAHHELRTPLTNILGYTEVLLDQNLGPLTGAQQHATEVVNRNAHRLLDLVTDLTLIAGQGPAADDASPDTAHVVSCVRDSWKALGQRRSGGPVPRLEFQVDPGSDRAEARVAPRDLGRCLEHVFGNAITHSPADSVVTVRLGVQQDRVRVETSDEGPGMTAEERARAFQPFVRGAGEHSAARQGAGLGFTLVQTVVERCGGSVTLTSTPGQGTTVTLLLPKA